MMYSIARLGFWILIIAGIMMTFTSAAFKGLLVLVGAFAVRFFFLRPVSSDTYFADRGVRVNYSDGTIAMGGTTLPVSTVKSFEVLKNGRGGAHVSIEWEDMNKPVHQFTFFSYNAADTFASRVKLAIKKAGGPTYS